ncbi:MAG: hypothetical protein KTQ49_04930 [Candidatus Omnitrophica bacterium]|nr:hypothetical protein [Candidatus Omnitrophota bacterium]
MLGANKREQPRGHDWFVVLNPLRSELDRQKIAKEIAQAFKLPVEEAMDLVAKTPIILVDNLLYATAIQIKQYFRTPQAEILVSNDGFLKRRCYRTVWPVPPSFSFLSAPEVQPMPQKTGEQEELDQEEAIQEIRSWVQTDESVPEQGIHTPNKNGHDNSRHFRSLLEEEREKLVKEKVGLKETIDHLNQSLQKTQADMIEKEKTVRSSESARKQQEKETQELQSLAGHAEEKYDLLREEFRLTRQHFEEKLAARDRQEEALLRQIEERELANKELLHEKVALQKGLEAVKNELERARDERVQSSLEQEQSIAQFGRDLENQKRMVADLNAKIQNLEEGKRIVQVSEARLIKEVELQTSQTRRWEQRATELEKEVRKLRQSFEDQTKSWQLRLAQLEAREHELETAREQIHQLRAELEQREMSQKKDQLHQVMQVKEARLKQIVKQQEKIETEIREREDELRKLLAEQEMTEREVIEAKQVQRHLTQKQKHEARPHEPREPSSACQDPLTSSAHSEDIDD